MIDCDFGEIVLVRFPFTDLSSTKRRPAVVVSSALYGQLRRDVLILAITSQAGPASRFDVPVANWRRAGLLKPSFLKPAIATLQRDLILGKLGRLDEDDSRSLRALLALMLG
jgi:mRNA interferase MazF